MRWKFLQKPPGSSLYHNHLKGILFMISHNKKSKQRFASRRRRTKNRVLRGRLRLNVPAGPFIDSACQFMRLAGRSFADLIGLEYLPNRPTLHRMLGQLQGWKRSWTGAAAEMFAPHFGCDPHNLAEFLVGAGPAPNAACQVAAEYEFQTASSLASLFVCPPGLLQCGSIVSVCNGIPLYLLPEIPRGKVVKVMQSLVPKVDFGNLDSLAALAEEQHDALVHTLPSNHHFIIDRSALSSLVRGGPPFNTFDGGDRIDVLGFLLNDICLNGRGTLSFPILSCIPLAGLSWNLSQFSELQRLGSARLVVQSYRHFLFGIIGLTEVLPGGIAEQHDRLVTQIHALNLADGCPQRAVRILRRLLDRAKK
jgi:hypothetical protein